MIITTTYDRHGEMTGQIRQYDNDRRVADWLLDRFHHAGEPVQEITVQLVDGRRVEYRYREETDQMSLGFDPLVVT